MLVWTTFGSNNITLRAIQTTEQSIIEGIFGEHIISRRRPIGVSLLTDFAPRGL